MLKKFLRVCVCVFKRGLNLELPSFLQVVSNGIKESLLSITRRHVLKKAGIKPNFTLPLFISRSFISRTAGIKLDLSGL